MYVLWHLLWEPRFRLDCPSYKSVIHCRPGLNDSRMLHPSHSAYTRWCYVGETLCQIHRGARWDMMSSVVLVLSCGTMSLLCQYGVSVITDVVSSGHTGVCRHVCVEWGQVGHPCQAMMEPGQGMSSEEEELDLLVGYSTPLSVHSVDGRCDSVYCSASQL